LVLGSHFIGLELHDHLSADGNAIYIAERPGVLKNIDFVLFRGN
jgi:hypothetical protein